MRLHDLIRRWAVSYTEHGKYSPVGVWFHWIMAGLVLFQLGSGWMMLRYPVGASKLATYELHSELGLTILFLAILRFGWRLLSPIRSTTPMRQAGRARQHISHSTFSMACSRYFR